MCEIFQWYEHILQVWISSYKTMLKSQFFFFITSVIFYTDRLIDSQKAQYTMFLKKL